MSDYVKPASALAALFLVGAVTVWAQSPSRTGPRDSVVRTEQQIKAGPESAELVRKIRHANQAEIEIGELAALKGQSERVRKYGEVLVRDHRLAERKLADVTERLNLNAKPADLDPEHAAVIQRLRSVEGIDFDREFLAAMHEGHQKVIGALETGRDSEIPALRELVGKLLPILRQHDKLALNLTKSHGAGGRHG